MNKVGIIGGSGFAGEELIRFLSSHENTLLHAISSRELKGKNVSEFVEEVQLSFVDPDDLIFFDCDVVFFATPHGISMKKAKSFLEKGIKVIDLSADFRINDPKIWKDWYGSDHQYIDGLKKSVYGLTELNLDSIKSSNLIAVPGCYPTASILGLLPVIQSRLEIDSITIDAKSGISGAGRSTVNNSLKHEIQENFRAYATQGHRHLPEIKQVLEDVYGNSLNLNFLPHLIPAMRGIYATIYVNLKNPCTESLFDLYKSYYEESPNVELMKEGEVPEILKVSNTNNCQIGIYSSAIDTQIVIISAIDNLVKGAAGQAIECYNLVCGNNQMQGLKDG